MPLPPPPCPASAPRAVCGQLLALLARADEEVSALVETSGRAPGARG
jgi:hypothetical protein